MGLPGAGKSTFAERLIAQGYHRLNRDDAGGTLRDLLPALDAALASGASRIVLDNTYVSRKSRAEVIRAASARGFPVRCIWLSTSVEDAQTNAAWRIVSRYGRLPGDAELERLRKRDVAAFLPTVQFRYQRELEPPDASRDSRASTSCRSSGGAIRRSSTARSSSGATACCFAADRGADRPRARRMSTSPADRAAVLARYRDEGWRLLGMSWQPEIAEGTQSPRRR